MSAQDIVAILDTVGVQWAAILVMGAGVAVGWLKLRDIARTLDEHLTTCHQRHGRALERLEERHVKAAAEGREGRAKLHERQDETNARIGEIAEAVARIEGRMDR